MRKLLMTASTQSHIHHFHLPYLQWFQSQLTQSGGAETCLSVVVIGLFEHTRAVEHIVQRGKIAQVITGGQAACVRIVYECGGKTEGGRGDIFLPALKGGLGVKIPVFPCVAVVLIDAVDHHAVAVRPLFDLRQHIAACLVVAAVKNQNKALRGHLLGALEHSAGRVETAVFEILAVGAECARIFGEGGKSLRRNKYEHGNNKHGHSGKQLFVHRQTSFLKNGYTSTYIVIIACRCK